jgi:hypothetical protein
VRLIHRQAQRAQAEIDLAGGFIERHCFVNDEFDSAFDASCDASRWVFIASELRVIGEGDFVWHGDHDVMEMVGQQRTPATLNLIAGVVVTGSSNGQ